MANAQLPRPDSDFKFQTKTLNLFCFRSKVVSVTDLVFGLGFWGTCPSAVARGARDTTRSPVVRFYLK